MCVHMYVCVCMCVYVCVCMYVYIYMYVYVHRYERKKCVSVALDACHYIHSNPDQYDYTPLLEGSRSLRVLLVVAGGYDPRVEENVAYHRELQSLAREYGFQVLGEPDSADSRSNSSSSSSSSSSGGTVIVDVVFRKSISLSERTALLLHSTGE